METVTTALVTAPAAIGATGVSLWTTLTTYFVGIGCSSFFATTLSVIVIASVLIGAFFILKYIWGGIKALWQNRGDIVSKVSPKTKTA